MSTSAENEKAAKDAVTEIGARVYTITEMQDKEAYFIVVGCHGNGGNAQKEVAQKINDFCKEKGRKPDFILFLGDNVYDYGAKSPTDPAFKTCAEDIYQNPQLTEICDVPCFYILGNHDENLHAKNFLGHKIPVGRETGLNEVAHTYIPDGKKYTTVEQIKNLFSESELPLTKLPPWAMPNFYYSLIIGTKQIFCLDSNAYAKDFLAFKNENIAQPEHNQAWWLQTEIEKAKAANREIMIAWHNPIVTFNKRTVAKNFDTRHYLSDKEIDEINRQVGKNSQSYQDILKAILDHQGITPQVNSFFVAHEHALGFYRDNELCQVLCGGGGGDLQAQYDFSKQENLGTRLKNNGFVAVDCNGEMTFEYCALAPYLPKGTHQLRFNTKSAQPLRTASDDSKLEALRENIITLCKIFFASQPTHTPKHRASSPQPKEASPLSYSGLFGAMTLSNLKWAINQSTALAVEYGTKAYHYMTSAESKLTDHDYVNAILAFLNEPTLLDMDTIIQTLMGIFDKFTDKTSDQSFLKLVQDMAQKKLDKDHVFCNLIPIPPTITIGMTPSYTSSS